MQAGLHLFLKSNMKLSSWGGSMDHACLDYCMKFGHHTPLCKTLTKGLESCVSKPEHISSFKGTYTSSSACS